MWMRTMWLRLATLQIVGLVVLHVHEAESFCVLSSSSSSSSSSSLPAGGRLSWCLSLVKIEGYDEAIRTIDQCSVQGRPSDDLYDAVRLIDRNANQIYPTSDDKSELWDRAHGSWKLQLATGGGKSDTFKPIPIFAFAMIDESNFGNGVGLNDGWILLSLLGPHIFNPQRRQMTITIEDMYLKQIFGKGTRRVTDSLPGFLKESIGLGKKPEEFKKAPAFTFIGASEKSLIARGGTGGIAIWTRLEKDIRPVAYSSKD